MIVGFTGSRKLSLVQQKVVSYRLIVCADLGMTEAITGACQGVDAFIALWILSEFPDMHQTIVVPHDRKAVPDDVLGLDKYNNNISYVYMSVGTNYRDRNEKIVELSDVMDAFWTGKRAYSGTYMTINIADKINKLRETIRI